MYIQWCVKGIAGPAAAGPTMQEAFELVDAGRGIPSNWWRNKGAITSTEVTAKLNVVNLDRHLHDYANFGPVSPFISLAAGCVERDTLLRKNLIHSAIDTALWFATDAWAHEGSLFYCWVIVGLNPAVEIRSLAESVRDLNVYRAWSPFQLEGEIVAKVSVPANQISHVEWWDGSHSKATPHTTHVNGGFIDPAPLMNIRELF